MLCDSVCLLRGKVIPLSLAKWLCGLCNFWCGEMPLLLREEYGSVLCLQKSLKGVWGAAASRKCLDQTLAYSLVPFLYHLLVL